MILSIDFESNGFRGMNGGAPEPLSVGIVICDFDFNILDSFYSLIRFSREKRFNLEAFAVHKIAFSELEKAPESKTIALSVIGAISCYASKVGKNKVIYHALNEFDLKILRDWMIGVGLAKYLKDSLYDYEFISTIEMSKSKKYPIQSNKLSTWASHLGKEFNHHNALDDAGVCMDIYKRLSMEAVLS